jgi:hypothetical protein
MAFLAFRVTGGAVSTRVLPGATSSEDESQRRGEGGQSGTKSILGIEEEDFPLSAKAPKKAAEAHHEKSDDAQTEDFDPLFFGNSVDSAAEPKRPVKKLKKGAPTEDHSQGGLDDIERQLGLR